MNTSTSRESSSWRVVTPLAIFVASVFAPSGASALHELHSAQRQQPHLVPDLAVESAESASTASGECEPHWTTTFGGLPGVAHMWDGASIRDAAVFDDGSGPALFVAGHFNLAGGIVAPHIAKWDGVSWSPLGSGMGFSVNALEVFDDGSGESLYAAGAFTTAGGQSALRIAKWDGRQWSPLADGLNGEVNALTVFDDGSGPALYAGGIFTTAGGVPASHIARWDGSQWTSLQNGTNARVRTLTVHDDGTGLALYVGGDFTSASGVIVHRLGRWDGTSWTSVGGGMYGPLVEVSALAVLDAGSGPALYAGGRFDGAGGVAASHLAKWDGQTWSPVGAGVNNFVTTLAVSDDGSGPALYASGAFTVAGGVDAVRIAKWDGKQWSAFGSGVTSHVNVFVDFDDGRGSAVYAAGQINTIDELRVGNIASWDGSQWSTLGGGLNNDVEVLAVFDDGSGPALHAAGRFSTASGMSVNKIAKWDGANWSPLGGGIGPQIVGWVRDMTVFDDGSGPALIAAGAFSLAGGETANYIAKWDGQSWSPLGSGTNSNGVAAVAVFDDGSGPALYAGGGFTHAGGILARGVAKWDGQEWSSLAGGVSSGGVLAFAVFDDGTGPALYAGGAFSEIGGVSANRIAKWDGVQWSALGDGVSGSVESLVVFDDGAGPALYAGGWFTTAGGVSANRVAKWDGVQWSALGDGIGTQNVNVLTVFDDGSGHALYAGGNFTQAGGTSVGRVAKWDGNEWSALGDGVDGPVLAAAVFDDGSGPAMFLGGAFRVSPGADSYIARYEGCAAPQVLGDINGDGVVDVTDLLILLGAWGYCPAPNDCPADLNSDGRVEVSDLLLLLANWTSVVGM